MNEWIRLARFSVIGVINTATDIILFSLLFYVLDASLILSNSIGYLIAATNSFFLNKYWTFAETRHQGNMRRQYLLFLLLGLVGLGLSNIVVFTLSFLMEAILAKVLSVFVVFLWSFTTTKLIVFRN